MGRGDERVEVDVDGRRLSLVNLDKVMYPLVGFTKADVIRYYSAVADVMLAHIADRGVTLRRWPDGVTGGSFFQKRCPRHRPEWIPDCPGPGDHGDPIRYCRLDSRAALVWAANLAALEIHAPMARCADIESPTMVVFDLDPGAPATIVDCCAVALEIRGVLDAVGLVACPKTSGGEGLQVYVPLNRPHTHRRTADFALAVARHLEQRDPDRVVTVMRKSARRGRVFIDWSQNARHKTTIAPYSLRGRERPTVSTPLDWEEVEAGAAGEPPVFEADEVLDRVESRGDLFAPAVTVEQGLPPGEPAPGTSTTRR